MATTREPRTIPVTEPVPIDPEFASGPTLVRSIEGMTYLVFHTEHVSPPEMGETRDRVITKRLVIPNDAARKLWRMLDAALTGGQPGELTADDFCDSAHHALTA